MIEQLRVSKIVMDMPKSYMETWVQITVQKVLRDKDTYEVKNIITKWSVFSVPLQDILNKTLPVDTQSNTVITGGEVLKSIYTLVLLMLKDKYGGIINEKQDLIL